VERSAILLVGNYSNKTGYAWKNIYRLFNVIAKASHARGISICLSFAKLEPPITFLDEDVPFESFEFDPNNITITNIFDLIKAIKKYRIKYVYFTDQHSYRLLYLLLRISGVKKIIVHSRVSVAKPYPAPPEKGLRKIVKTVIGNLDWITPDRIYAVSDFVRARLVNNNCLPENKVVVILNGIDLGYFRCAKYQVNSDQLFIFAGARAVEHKGILTLIRAAYLLLNEYEITNFIIKFAGDGPDLNKFVLKIKDQGLDQHFIFLGQLDDIRRALCEADVVVVPSVWGDACPSAVSEALAAGKPLVTTYAGGIPEIVGDETNAVLIPPSDERALANALAELIVDSDKREKLGIRARKRAVEALDEKDYYKKIIKQLISDLYT